MKFLFLKYQAKELTSQVEMLKKVLRGNQEHFLEVFSQASESLQLVCGVEVREVDPREHIYIMVPTLGLTWVLKVFLGLAHLTHLDHEHDAWDQTTEVRQGNGWGQLAWLRERGTVNGLD